MKNIIAIITLMLILLTGCSDNTASVTSEKVTLQSSNTLVSEFFSPELPSTIDKSQNSSTNKTSAALESMTFPDWISDEKVNSIVQIIEERDNPEWIEKERICAVYFALADIDKNGIPEFFCGDMGAMWGKNIDIKYLSFSLSNLKPIQAKNKWNTVRPEESELYFFALREGDLFGGVYYLNQHSQPYYMILSQYIYESFSQGHDVKMEAITYADNTYTLDKVDYPNTAQSYPMATATVEVDMNNIKESVLQCINLYVERDEVLNNAK